MARCPACKKHFRVLEDEDDGQHGCPYCGYGDEPRLLLDAYLADEPCDPIDPEWRLLIEAVDSGQFGPETEVEL